MNPHPEENWRARRDRKLFTMLDPNEPAWLVDEQVEASLESVVFDVVHRWYPYRWARRRFLYDIPGDVMHFRGATPIDDSELSKLKPEQRLRHPQSPV
jgi:hypothetical protein